MKGKSMSILLEVRSNVDGIKGINNNGTKLSKHIWKIKDKKNVMRP